MPSVEGLDRARRAALRMLDAVLRRGQTMDSAAAVAAGLPPADRALAMRHRRRDAAPPARPRRADRQRHAAARCPTTARRGWCCAWRWPRRSASARPTMRWSRPPCRWSTAARGGWSMACSAPCCAAALPPLDAPRLARGGRASAGARPGARRSSRPRAARSRSARRSTSASPTMASAGLPRPPAACRWRRAIVRLPSSVGRRAARLRRGRLVGAGPRRLASRAADSRPTPRTCSTSAPRRAARRCSSPPPAIDVTALDRVGKSSRHDCARISRAPGSTAKLVAADALDWTARPALRRGPARRALLGDRHLPPPSRSALPRAAARSSREAPSCQARAARTAPPTG